jgi:hypothetical protein
MACRVGVREPCFVGRGGPTGPNERGLRVGDGRGRGKMPGQLGREHRGAPSVPTDQRLSYPSMQIHPLGLRERGVDRLAVQVVAEPYASGRRTGRIGIGRPGQHSAGDRLLHQLGHPRRVLAQGVREHIGLRMRPGHCTGLEQPGAVGCQPRQPAGHQLADRRWYARDIAARGQQGRQLPCEEGVPLAAAGNDRTPPRGGRLTGKCGYQLVHLGRA